LIGLMSPNNLPRIDIDSPHCQEKSKKDSDLILIRRQWIRYEMKSSTDSHLLPDDAPRAASHVRMDEKKRRTATSSPRPLQSTQLRSEWCTGFDRVPFIRHRVPHPQLYCTYRICDGLFY
jgi:hypothetical protein